MSNLGIQAIYSLINSYPNAVCERVFWDKGDKKSAAEFTLTLNVVKGNMPPLS